MIDTIVNKFRYANDNELLREDEVDMLSNFEQSSKIYLNLDLRLNIRKIKILNTARIIFLMIKNRIKEIDDIFFVSTITKYNEIIRAMEKKDEWNSRRLLQQYLKKQLEDRNLSPAIK